MNPSDEQARVLIVDDEPLLIYALQRILSRRFRTTTVESALKARELIVSGERYDVIICDLNMPEFSGLDLLQWLQEHHPATAERLLLVSGGALADADADQLVAMPERFIQKPFDMMQLTRRIEALAQAR